MPKLPQKVFVFMDDRRGEERVQMDDREIHCQAARKDMPVCLQAQPKARPAMPKMPPACQPQAMAYAKLLPHSCWQAEREPSSLFGKMPISIHTPGQVERRQELLSGRQCSHCPPPGEESLWEGGEWCRQAGGRREAEVRCAGGEKWEAKGGSCCQLDEVCPACLACPAQPALFP